VSKLIDLTGMRFGRLVVIERAGTYSSFSDPDKKYPTWRCRCDCGAETIVVGGNLRFDVAEDYRVKKRHKELEQEDSK
jgi:hypothetical protein